MMAVVDMIVRALRDKGWDAAFTDTSGNCCVVEFRFGPVDAWGYGRYLFWITERDDNFSWSDIAGADDDRMSGFLAGLHILTSEGERVHDDGFTIYRSAQELVSREWVESDGPSLPPGAFVVDLQAEISAVVDAVDSVARAVRAADVE